MAGVVGINVFESPRADGVADRKTSLPLWERLEDVGVGRIDDAKYLPGKFPLISYSLVRSLMWVKLLA
jgi:hypothetical protein